MRLLLAELHDGRVVRAERRDARQQLAQGGVQRGVDLLSDSSVNNEVSIRTPQDEFRILDTLID